MKKWFAGLMVLLVLSLAGCAVKAPVWETVDDAIPVSARAEESGTLVFTVPEDAAETADGSTDARLVYEQRDGDYEIVSETITGESLAEAVRTLSGFGGDRLGLVKTACGGLPGYQFAWYESGEEGGRFCRAELVMDGAVCHAVTFSVREELGNRYDTTAEALFSSIRIQEKNPV